MSLIVFLIILSILVLVHEWGHYITAKKCGVNVEQFSLGFGPKLYSRMHDGTEFCLCAIPLGGYVKMSGDEREKCKGTKDEYFSQSVGNRSLIVLMGPVVNVVLAFVCFWLVFMIGFVDMEASAKKVAPFVGQVVENSPAQKAGLKTGDKVITINDKVINHWPDLQDYIVESKTPQLAFVVERDKERVNVTITPKEEKQKDIFGREHNTRRIGVGPVQIKDGNDVVIVRYGPFGAMRKAVEEIFDISGKTYKALYEMVIGLRSPKEAMGIVGMFFVIKFALTVSFSFLLHIVGVISLSLAIFNLLPLIPLDGGHLLMLAIEKIRGKALSLKTDLMITKVGFGLILMLALFVFYVDFERIGLFEKVMNVFKPMG
jgi:regulator of sigma E protease